MLSKWIVGGRNHRRRVSLFAGIENDPDAPAK
jgi:hypothetical protein